MWGSSPLTRGGPALTTSWCVMSGLIPAYAGRTIQGSRKNNSPTAHPRLRGADRARAGRATTSWGSSPLTRGGPLGGLGGGRRWRLIPAYAGRTHFPTRQEPANPAHPRLRGADYPKCAEFVCVWGSSPLTRGGLGCTCRFLARLRLIPAYAGRTTPRFGIGSPATAHPRLRGADSSSDPMRSARPGSSPLTRGGRE